MTVSRRRFLESLTATAAGLTALPRSVLSNTPPVSANNDTKLTLSTPLTHSDWLLKSGGPPWGEAGVRHMLDACKAAGWSNVYWRVFDAGVSTYPSKFLRAGDRAEKDNFFAPANDADLAARQKFSPVTSERSAEILGQLNKMDYGQFDSLAAAIRYGHEIGLKIWAWATINEDDHGWGWPSEFSKAHQDFHWVRRDGKPYHSQLSFAFPEVSEYKLSLLDELLVHYEIDGLFLDWIRTGDVRDNPQTDAKGVANNGYETPNVAAFKAKYNVDPHDVPNDDDRWVRLRAEAQTQFMRAVRRRVSRIHKKQIPIAVMVGHPWHYRGMQDPIDGNLRGLLLDVATWANEGLMDFAIAAGYYRAGGDAIKAFNALHDEVKGRVDLWYYAWVPQSPEEFQREFDAARNVGAERMLFWEADYIDDRPNAAALKQIMSSNAKS